MEIKLKGKYGGTVLYSPEDHELISQCTWSIKGEKGYCVGKLETGRMVRMNRFIMGEPKGKIVDHINGNKLDNRRENLRITDMIGNGQNKAKKKALHQNILEFI